jgi:hypothetical protein
MPGNRKKERLTMSEPRDAPRIETEFDLTGRLVQLQPGLAMPERYSASVDDPDLPFTVRITVVVEQGRPVCESLAAERRPEGIPITIESLRLPVARLIRETAPLVALAVRETDAGSKLTPSTPAEQEQVHATIRSSRKPKRGPNIEQDQRLDRVAEIYRAALASGAWPTQAVAEGLHVSRSHAGRLVMMARRRGKLGPTLPGKKGEAHS